jgi:hypothetical protein
MLPSRATSDLTSIQQFLKANMNTFLFRNSLHVNYIHLKEQTVNLAIILLSIIELFGTFVLVF